MSLTQYSTTQEVVRDHERECQRCGKNYPVVWRIYGTGISNASNSILSNFTNAHDRAADRAAQYAQQIVLDKAIKQTVYWHRCTKCGYYSDLDLDIIRNSLKGFRRQRRIIRVFSWFIGCLFFPMGLLLFIALLFDPPDQSKNEPSLLALTIFTLLFILAGGLFLWLGWWISSKRRFDKNLTTLNYEDRTIKWLENWEKKGIALIKDLNNTTYGKDLTFEKLKRLQFGKDLVSPYYARSSDYIK